MVKGVLFSGAMLGVLGLMGYGVYEAFSWNRADSRLTAAPPDWAAEAWTAPVQRGGVRGQGFGRTDTLNGPGWGGGPGAGSAGVPGVPDGVNRPESIQIAGSVVSIDGTELVVLTPEGESVTSGLGKPSYWESQGVALQAGDAIRLTGFWEDGEFEVQSLTKLTSGQTVSLRDDSGRPLWAGGGRWAAPVAGGSGQSF